MRSWVARTAALREDHEWHAASSRGWLCAFSPVASPGHSASLRVDPGVRLVGDVPVDWLAGSNASVCRSRLANPCPEGTSAAIPDTEFALGAWSDDTSTLTLYRCPLGARALLYVCEPRSWIAFASLPEPLLAVPGVRARINEAAVALQLIGEDYYLQAEDATSFSKLRRLPAGHVLRFGESGVALSEYWGPNLAPPMDFGVDDPEVPAAMRRLIEAAVQRRVHGFNRVGSQLSGGMDSSAVTALAHARLDAGARLFTYTVRALDEQGQAVHSEEQRLASALTTELTTVTSRILPRHMAHRPSYLSGREVLERPLPEWAFRAGLDRGLLNALRDDGCSIVLTGWGGDEMVSARTRLHLLTMLAEGRWQMAMRNLASPNGCADLFQNLQRDLTAPLRAGLLPRPRWPTEVDESVRRIFGGKPLASWVSRARWHRGSLSLRQYRWRCLRASGFSQVLELHDWLGQQSGVSPSYPLLDRELVAFCHRMPAEWVTCGGIVRRGFRAALTNVLSSGHHRREKTRRPRVDNHKVRYRHHLLAQRALQDLAESGTWLHDYLNFSALVAAKRASAGMTGKIERIVAAVLVMARLEYDGVS